VKNQRRSPSGGAVSSAEARVLFFPYFHGQFPLARSLSDNSLSGLAAKIGQKGNNLDQSEMNRQKTPEMAARNKGSK
jgi:hypothetical protein